MQGNYKFTDHKITESRITTLHLNLLIILITEYHDVNKNEMKLKCPKSVKANYTDLKKQTQILFSGHEKSTPFIWLKCFTTI